MGLWDDESDKRQVGVVVYTWNSHIKFYSKP